MQSSFPCLVLKRDPLKEVEVVTDIVQVFDLVGLNVNGFVNGKEYYGNVYLANGVKFAGTSAQGGTNTEVFETREASISGVNVPVARVNRVEEDIQTSTTPTTQTITAEVRNYKSYPNTTNRSTRFNTCTITKCRSNTNTLTCISNTLYTT